MIFNSDELGSIAAWMTTAKPLADIYYRSVEYRYMDPKEVLSGRGAAHYGGRFASVGTRAVYLAESDGGASGEVLARKQRLGGNAQITLDKYPRIVFGVSVSLDRVLDFTKKGLPPNLLAVGQNCLAPDDLTPSMEMGDLLRARSIQRARRPKRSRPQQELGRLFGALSSQCAGDSQCLRTDEKDAADS